MASMAQLRFSPLSGHYHASDFPTSSSSQPQNQSLYPIKLVLPRLKLSSTGGDGGNGIGHDGSGGSNSGGGGGGSWGHKGDHSDSSSFGPLGLFLNGWRSRVVADSQFPFKVLMEELVGVSACVLGDMASRPNFGLNELDFVFSTLVVGSILNFTLMYLLAPTMSTSSSQLPSFFASCPKSHMFEPGTYGLFERLGTLVYKGTIFAAVGFAAGLAGTALSNGLITMRRKMDPNFETPNKPPPTMLNALTWAAHMGFSSNFRYQTLNGIEFLLERGLNPFLFKSSVLVLRMVNNVLGGMSFVVLARLTGAQSVGSSEHQKEQTTVKIGFASEKEKLVEREEEFQSSNQSASSK